MRWRLADGRLEPVRCGASNRCDYCAFLTAVENAAVVKWDAKHNSAPTAGVTTTTHRSDFPLEKLRKAEEHLWRALRRDFGVVEYLGFLEFTTGKGGRGRMPHLHHLAKGLPADVTCAPERGLSDFEQRVSELWRKFTGGAFIVEARELRTAAGAIAYLSLHHNKREQAIPAHLHGTKRFRPSRGYFDEPLGVLRDRVRGIVRDRRVWQEVVTCLVDDVPDGVPGDVWEELLEARLEVAFDEAAASPKPELVSVQEVERLNQDTGEIRREVFKVVGPVERGRP